MLQSFHSARSGDGYCEDSHGGYDSEFLNDTADASDVLASLVPSTGTNFDKYCAGVGNMMMEPNFNKIIVEESDDDKDLNKASGSVTSAGPAAAAVHQQYAQFVPRAVSLPMAPPLLNDASATSLTSQPSGHNIKLPHIVAITSSSSTSTTGSPKRGMLVSACHMLIYVLCSALAASHVFKGRLSLLRGNDRAAAKQVLNIGLFVVFWLFLAC